MYGINDTIMYGTQGICKIFDIAEKEFMGVKKEYYILKPMCDKDATIFVPIHNRKLQGKMRKILSKEQIYELLRTMPAEEAVWIENENERKEAYTKIIRKGDHCELIRMIKSLYARKREREYGGKKLYLSDERFFKEAERILYDEFQYVLEIGREEMILFIVKEVEKECHMM